MNLKNYIKEKILSVKNYDRPTIIGIDGPTAAGKTYLAEDLKILLKKNFNSIWICQLDWTLKNRKYRSDSLKFFKKQNLIFNYESQDHMVIDQITKTLKKIRNFDYKKNKNINIILRNLYDRSSSLNNLFIKRKINKNTLVILEGHYTSINELDDLIDYNVLLLSKNNELLSRKINRVKHYRNSKETKQYFDLIDVPSFQIICQFLGVIMT